MSITDVDIILKRLSSKFHKIFYDREFVCCVQEDFEVILKNRNRCCVVVFPLLGPIYLKAVQYQAKFFDLEVFTLGTDKICSIAVCDQKFLIKKTTKCEEQIMQINEQECGAGSTLKKKRPERQLYVPPAQRRLPVSELPLQNNAKHDQGNSTKPKKHTSSNKKRESQKKIKNCDEIFKCEPENILQLTEDPITDAIENKTYTNIENYSLMWWKYGLFEPSFKINKISSNNSVMHFKEMLCNFNFDGYKIFGLKRNIKSLYLLGNNYFLWQPKMDVFVDRKGINFNVKVIPPSNLDVLNIEVNVCERVALTEVFVPRQTYLDVLESCSNYCDFNVYWLRKSVESCKFLDVCCQCYYYIIKEDIYNGSKFIEEWMSDLLSSEDCHEQIELEPQNISEKAETPESNIPINEKPIPTDFYLQKNNMNNSNLNYLKNTINVRENVKEKNELEEEKEIMRKAKENINRKTRPIIKYVDEVKDTLKIEKDDVNNWEDLFDEEGQLQDDLLKEIVHKVGSDVTIIKAKEDYSDYFTKHVNIEELEHMVELYDFPSTLETHDLIHAFSEIKSDAMYVKWVDDTHAILVLGSSSQAQKAISVQNPLIKVRPMTAASKVSLSTAYRTDLKPAMKRPPTNLQTARRLITTHLGTKSGISKERSAKERDDLKAAREMKKLVKKNEQDAWEGKLKSSIN